LSGLRVSTEQIFSIVIIAFLFYRFYFVERNTLPDNDLSDVICVDLFYKNIRPVCYSLSLLLITNLLCVIILISGITGVQNIHDIFFNFVSPDLEYASLISQLAVVEKNQIENTIKNLEFYYVLSILIQTAIVLMFTYSIHKKRPPYPGSKHIAIILKCVLQGIKKREFKFQQILSSLYYIVMKYSENFFRLFYFVLFGLGIIFWVWSLSLTLGLPEFSSNSQIIIRGVLIGVIQLIAFVLLLDYFENSQINQYYFNKLNQFHDLKTTIELSHLNDTPEKLDYYKMVNELEFSKILQTKRIGFPIFSIPFFSLNSISLNTLDSEYLKTEYNFQDEKLMILTNTSSLFIEWGVVFVYAILISLSLSLNEIIGSFSIISILVLTIGCALILRWIKKNLSPAFS